MFLSISRLSQGAYFRTLCVNYYCTKIRLNFKIPPLKEHSEVTPYGAADKTKKGQVEDMFDSIAPQYDFLNHLLSLNIDKIWRNRAVKLLRPKQPKQILDVATGTGDFAIALRKLNPDRIVGLDLSEQMLSYGRVKIQKRGLDKLITMVKGDSEALPFEDNTFDAITVAYGVRNFENTVKGLTEMHRVMKPGGTMVVLEFSKPKVFPVKQIFYFYFHFVLPLVGRLFSKDRRAYTYLPESVEAFPGGDAFLKLMQQGGFKATKQIPLSFGISSIYHGVK